MFVRRDVSRHFVDEHDGTAAGQEQEWTQIVLDINSLLDEEDASCRQVNDTIRARLFSRSSVQAEQAAPMTERR